ncbi:HAD family hydrolase [Streptomyces roseolus]|uniref:HAD family hydrolase n=1 Tax=Streptomyces roseolus TaxID=67358 RepID=UPI00198FBB8B|nr:HAD family hydrolase [Streptomyces roseolus]GGR63221.1 haloacid dehalogenase [Streptomyces roseolus]
MTTGKYGMVALDIDDTLINFDDEATRSVIEAVHNVIKSGAHVVLATGRGMFAAQSVIRMFELKTGHCVASNGAVTFSYQPFEVTRTLTFDPRPVVEAALRKLPEALVAVEVVGRGYRVNQPFPSGEIGGEMWIDPIEKLMAEPVTRVLVRDPAAAPHRHQEFAPEGVSKISGLAVLAESFGLGRQDVLAIGDGMNDIEMLQWAGRGVAMGQAKDAVKAAADAVTGSITEDGVAMELNRWF